MQRTGKDWGVYSSLPKAIEALKATYTSDPSPPYSPSTSPSRKLTFHVYFSSSDVMIGKGGQQYFEDCWRQGNEDGKIEYKAKVAEDTDHDSIILPEKGWIEEVFGEVKKVCG